MPATLDGKLVVAISSRALFDLSASHHIFEQGGLEEYRHYQIAHENDPLQPGTAFPLIRRLLDLRYPDSGEAVAEVILFSKNDVDTGLRVLNSIEHYALPVTRAVFTRGTSPFPYLNPFQVDLFLSADHEDVRAALNKGHASAMIFTDLSPTPLLPLAEIRIAFDGDAVLFSDEAEQVYQTEGLSAFQEHERSKAHLPLAPGPFKPFLSVVHRIQSIYAQMQQRPPIRTSLVTARSAPAHKRVIHTLRHWGITIDEAFFLGGLPKAPVLAEWQPHIFFDDQRTHCEPAAQVVPTAQVLSGITNAAQQPI
ncbi:MAG: 5'-nucleotidase [Synechococcales cyanobacterium]